MFSLWMVLVLPVLEHGFHFKWCIDLNKIKSKIENSSGLCRFCTAHQKRGVTMYISLKVACVLILVFKFLVAKLSTSD